MSVYKQETYPTSATQEENVVSKALKKTGEIFTIIEVSHPFPLVYIEKRMRFVRLGGIPFLGICSERTGGSAVIIAKEAER